jgi:hypothetical protein
MSELQYIVADWPVALAGAISLALIIIYAVTTQRKISQLQADFKQMSDDLKELQIAEHRRFLKEIKAPSKTGPAKAA